VAIDAKGTYPQSDMQQHLRTLAKYAMHTSDMPMQSRADFVSMTREMYDWAKSPSQSGALVPIFYHEERRLQSVLQQYGTYLESCFLGGLTKEERIAQNGGTYTRDAFLRHYGDERGEKEWAKAGAAEPSVPAVSPSPCSSAVAPQLPPVFIVVDPMTAVNIAASLMGTAMHTGQAPSHAQDTRFVPAPTPSHTGQAPPHAQDTRFVAAPTSSHTGQAPPHAQDVPFVPAPETGLVDMLDAQPPATTEGVPAVKKKQAPATTTCVPAVKKKPNRSGKKRPGLGKASVMARHPERPAFRMTVFHRRAQI